MKPDASVIIPTYNRRQLLQRTLMSLADQTYPAGRFEVIVVDDGSTDGTEDMVQALNVPYPLHYVRQPNQGRAVARNTGVRAAASDLLIFLDSDVAVARQFIEAHVRAHDEPMRVVKGPVIHVSTLDAPLDTEPKLSDMSRAFFATANVSVARRHFEEAGFFNETFREYGWEDLEMGDRLRDLGLRSYTADQARGIITVRRGAWRIFRGRGSGNGSGAELEYCIIAFAPPCECGPSYCCSARCFSLTGCCSRGTGVTGLRLNGCSGF